MSQQLILPINNTRLTASWKTDAYAKRFGFVHYGVDMVSSQGQALVYASGAGQVLAAGYDGVLGYSLVIRYDGALRKNKDLDMICRMFHFDALLVRQGQRVTKDTRLGYYGDTGRYSAGAHLHLEVDTDIKYPFFTPTLSGQSTLFKGSRLGATDETMSNPLEWLHCKVSSPDYQTYTHAGDVYIRPEDKTIREIL